MQEAFIFEGPKVRNLDFDDVIEPFGLDRRKVRKAYVTVKFLIFSSVHLEGPGVGERRGLVIYQLLIFSINPPDRKLRKLQNLEYFLIINFMRMPGRFIVRFLRFSILPKIIKKFMYNKRKM